ncbi:hypothetical protein L2E82_34070 [Cichorium intybus]|uniref:Uncharacterized protein n=1 Tax=Cichorium intybus TaxID=13427 RepID=A0ACB9BLK1_CICIN|nr:hypothetical protein L2E82_34070 [Cichorium intybus]
MADEAKAKGNTAFSAGNYTEAIRHFTDAISFAPTNQVLYSNQSAAYASLNQYFDALTDAKKTVDLKPDWSKGYSRLIMAASIPRYITHQRRIDVYEKGPGFATTDMAKQNKVRQIPVGEMFPARGWNRWRVTESDCLRREITVAAVDLSISFGLKKTV